MTLKYKLLTFKRNVNFAIVLGRELNSYLPMKQSWLVSDFCNPTCLASQENLDELNLRTGYRFGLSPLFF